MRYMSYDPTRNFREIEGTLREAIERACRLGIMVYTARGNGPCRSIADCATGTPRWSDANPEEREEYSEWGREAKALKIPEGETP